MKYNKFKYKAYRTSTYKGLFLFAIYIAMLFGYCRSWYQFCTSDFEPIGKREIVYGIGCFTFTGVILGYLNISDNQYVLTPIPNQGRIPDNPAVDSTH